jgi:virginiamycin B lyase
MTLGPDGNVWYVDIGREQIGRVAPNGSFKQFPFPHPAGGSHTLVAGPDGNVWAISSGAGSDGHDWLVRVTPAGTMTRFAAGGAGSALDSVTAGLDGNLWFTEVFGNQIGRLTPSGVLSEFPSGSNPRDIVTVPDGTLWFTMTSAVGRITTQGQFDVRIALPTNESIDGGSIIAGPDGNPWFIAGEELWRADPDTRTAARVTLPDGSRAWDLAAGPDGNVWFTDGGNFAIGRITVAGAVREFPMPRRDGDPGGMAVGSDGRIWFTEYGGRIGSIGARVPEASFSRRVVNFGSGVSQTVTVTSTGDAPLNINRVQVGGNDSAYFSLPADTCSGKSLSPGSRCDITVQTSGDESSLRAALLEVADNGTGSPQLVSLVAGLRACKLPVTMSSGGRVPQGQHLDPATGLVSADPKGGFVRVTDSTVRTTTAPVLTGWGPGYFDSSSKRWLPVPTAAEISPDGTRYAYSLFESDAIAATVHVVDVATGNNRALKLPAAPWHVLAFAKEGIYVNLSYEGLGPGLSLVNPDTGAMRSVLTTGFVQAITGKTVWIASRNLADKLPDPGGIGPANNTISTRDLTTGATTTWLYRPGTDIYVTAVFNGQPIVSVGTMSEVTYMVVSAPNTAKVLNLPFTLDRNPQLYGFVSDPMGLWLGTKDGVYLWTARTGGVLVSEVDARPAGTCA